MTDPTTHVMPGVPVAARWLGLSGLIPFVGLAMLMLIGWPEGARGVLLGYGVAILSFMGGCRWGFAATGMGEGPDWVPLIVSVLPALYAWVVMWLPGPFGFFGLALGFILLFSADQRLTRQGGAPDWWPALRLPLTIGAAGSLTLAGFL
ncbi:MAG: DUF3429 domain-containing protein [Pseudomonadota bacterium]